MTWPTDVDALLGAVRPIAAREIAPAAARWDSNGELEPDVASRLAQWGMFGVSVAEQAGGVGAGMLGAAAVVEEIASHSGALAMRLALHEAVAIGFALETSDTAMLGRLIDEAVWDNFPNLKRWHDDINDRPAVQRGRYVAKELGERKLTEVEEQARRELLFNQTNEKVRKLREAAARSSA